MVLLSMCIVIARHCSSFPSHLTHISMEKGYTFVYKTNFTYKGFHNISPLIKICLRRQGGFKCVTALTFANKTISKNILANQKYTCICVHLSLIFLLLFLFRIEA